MRRPPAACPEWVDVWTAVMDELADGWNDGSVDDAAIWAALAERTGMTPKEVEQHAYRCCTSIDVHPVAWRVASERRRPQALVTVNPDLFGPWIGPHYGLSAMFDTIVISAVERTGDKTELCTIALERLGYDGPRAAALLIDNRRDLLDAWAATGGAAYHFRGDAQFAEDVAHLLP
jgi:hypothetical protein